VITSHSISAAFLYFSAYENWGQLAAQNSGDHMSRGPLLLPCRNAMHSYVLLIISAMPWPPYSRQIDRSVLWGWVRVWLHEGNLVDSSLGQKQGGSTPFAVIASCWDKKSFRRNSYPWKSCLQITQHGGLISGGIHVRLSRRRGSNCTTSRRSLSRIDAHLLLMLHSTLRRD